MEEDLRRILDAGLAAADPKAVVLRSLKLDGDRILAGGESFEPERVRMTWVSSKSASARR